MLEAGYPGLRPACYAVGMPERLYQSRFNEHFDLIKHREVTPQAFSGLYLPHRQRGLDHIDRIAPELGRFVREAQACEQITSPQAAAEYLLKHIYTPFDQFDQEEVWLLLLNTKNRITHEVMLYRGTVNAAYIRPVELFKEAVRANATALIMSHCHPSGDPAPSPEDAQVTRNAAESARLLGIEFLDHIIVGSQGRWVSLKEQGLGFGK